MAHPLPPPPDGFGEHPPRPQRNPHSPRRVTSHHDGSSAHPQQLFLRSTTMRRGQRVRLGHSPICEARRRRFPKCLPQAQASHGGKPAPCCPTLLGPASCPSFLGSLCCQPGPQQLCHPRARPRQAPWL